MRWPARPLLVGRYALSDRGDRGNTGRGAFLGDYAYAPGERLGDLPVAAIARPGLGRVVVFGDTSSFQNVVLPFSYPFVADLFDDLARPAGAHAGSVETAAGVMAIALCLLGIAGWRAAPIGLAAAVATAALATTAGCAPAPLQRLTPGAPVALVDAAHMNAYATALWHERSIGGLIVNLQRNGYLPLIVRRRLPARIDPSMLPVILAPRTPLTRREVASLAAHLESGGAALVAAGSDHRDAVGALLARYGLSIGTLPLGPVPIVADMDRASFERALRRPQFRSAWPVRSRGLVRTRALYRGFGRDIVVEAAIDAKHGPGGRLLRDRRPRLPHRPRSRERDRGVGGQHGAARPVAGLPRWIVTPRLRVVGALLMALAWGFLDGFYVEPRPGLFWAFTVSGFACFLLAGGERRTAGGASRLAAAAAAPASIAALLVALQCVLPVIASHLHAIPGAGRAAAAVLSAAGLDAGVDGGGALLLPAAPGARAFRMTWEAAAGPSLARILPALLVAAPARSWRLIAIVSGYGACRLVAMALVIAGGARVPLLYEPAVTLVGFLPLASMALGGPGSGYAPERRARPWAHAVAMLATGAVLLGTAWGYRNPGRPGEGRVLVDESHSDWEWTEPPFDHTRYGQRSLYNYGLWRTWIGLHYPTRVTSRTPGESDLDGTDVLIIKTPTSPYDEETIARIERFVRRGGGLYLIGDHTNLFGMSTVLNGVAAPYGIRFNFDDTFPLDHERDDVFKPSPAAPHPILRGIATYPFETSCTLDVPWRAEHVIVGRRLGAEEVDYGHVNFFGDIHLDPDERFGLFVQAAVVAHGRGRVAAFSDSTNFSSFSLLWPGRRELTLNMIDWLSRRRPPGSAWVRPVLALLGLLLAGAGALRLGPLDRPAASLALWIALGGMLTAAWTVSSVTLPSRDSPPNAASPRAVIFDIDVSRPGIAPHSPLVSRDALPSWLGFNSLFIDAARSGLWPRTGALARALEGDDPIVSVLPGRRLTAGEISALDGYLGRGGRLLVIDSIMSPGSAADAIVSRYGLRSRRVTGGSGGDEGSGEVVPRLELAAEDGEQVTLAGGVGVVWRQVGRGRILVAGDGALFSDRSLGGVYAIPDRAQQSRHRGQRELMDLLMADPAPVSAP